MKLCADGKDTVLGETGPHRPKPLPWNLPIACPNDCSALNPDHLIIGAGVVGLSLAWELARRGKQVLVLGSERRRPASWAGAGILPPAARCRVIDPHEQLKKLSHELHKSWADELRAATGVDTGFVACGGIYLATTQAEAATLAANRFWWDEHQIESKPLSADQAVAEEPLLNELRGRINGAVLLPDECQLRNPRHLKALKMATRALGSQVLDDAEVIDIQTSNGRVANVRTADQVYQAENYSICSGAWSRFSLDDLEIQNGVVPIRGQMIQFDCQQAIFRRIINEGNRYLVCRPDGLVLAGSVEEEEGFRCETTEAAIDQIRSWALGILPALRQFPIVSSWAGLRPAAFDSFPYIGKAPSYDNLYIATGHFRSGLHLSPGTAVVLADLILGQTPEIDLTMFRPGRG